jgi:hypothetical protein
MENQKNQIFLKLFGWDTKEGQNELLEVLREAEETFQKNISLKDNVDNSEIFRPNKKIFEKYKKLSKNKKLIGGYEVDVYSTPPKTYKNEWVFYIPIQDFKRDTYSKILPPSVNKSKNENLCYGKLLPESYYYGKLEKLGSRYYIDIDKSKISSILDERINEIYRNSRETFRSIPVGYPTYYNIKEYLKAVDIIKKYPNGDWNTLISEEYHLIFGGNGGFDKLISSIPRI